MRSRQAGRALDIDPASSDAQDQRTAARTELGKLITRRVELAQKAIAAGSFKRREDTGERAQ